MQEDPKITMMQEIAEELRGTAGTLDAALEERGFELDSLPPELLQELDEAVRMCEACGWWCDTDEIDDDGNCGDCGEDEDDKA